MILSEWFKCTYGSIIHCLLLYRVLPSCTSIKSCQEAHVASSLNLIASGYYRGWLYTQAHVTSGRKVSNLRQMGVSAGNQPDSLLPGRALLAGQHNRNCTNCNCNCNCKMELYKLELQLRPEGQKELKMGMT